MDIRAIVGSALATITIPDSYKGYQGWPVPDYPNVVSKQEFGVGSVTGHLHRGRDLSVPEGTPVYAANDGTVTLTYTQGYNVPPNGDDGSPGGYGNQVRISNGANFETRYGHLSQVKVSNGEPVSQGEIIGYSGNTGKSTGPHLHFEDVYTDLPVDPVPILGGESTHPTEDWKAIYQKAIADISALFSALPEVPTREDIVPIRDRANKAAIDLEKAGAPEAVVDIFRNLGKHLVDMTLQELKDVRSWWERFRDNLPDVPNPLDVPGAILDGVKKLIPTAAAAIAGVFLIGIGVWGLIGNAPGGKTLEGLASTVATGGTSRVSKVARRATREKTPNTDWAVNRAKEMNKK